MSMNNPQLRKVLAAVLKAVRPDLDPEQVMASLLAEYPEPLPEVVTVESLTAYISELELVAKNDLEQLKQEFRQILTEYVRHDEDDPVLTRSELDGRYALQTEMKNEMSAYARLSELPRPGVSRMGVFLACLGTAIMTLLVTFMVIFYGMNPHTHTTSAPASGTATEEVQPLPEGDNSVEQPPAKPGQRSNRRLTRRGETTAEVIPEPVKPVPTVTPDDNTVEQPPAQPAQRSNRRLNRRK